MKNDFAYVRAYIGITIVPEQETAFEQVKLRNAAWFCAHHVCLERFISHGLRRHAWFPDCLK